MTSYYITESFQNNTGKEELIMETKQDQKPEQNPEQSVKCDICHRTLKKKESIARGRGPVCAAKQDNNQGFYYENKGF